MIDEQAQRLGDAEAAGVQHGSFWLNVAGGLVVTICVVCCSDLIAAWNTSPLDRFGWIALMLWLSPLLRFFVRGDRRLAIDPRRARLLLAALALATLGELGSLNVAQHMSVLLAAAAWLGWRGSIVCWLVAGICWMPAFGWLMSKAAPGAVLPARLLLAGGGACFLLRCEYSPLPGAMTPRWNGRLAAAAALLLLLAASLGWQFLVLPGAEHRLLAWTAAGPGFHSRGMSLADGELAALGDAIACRRLFHVGQQRVVVTAIDATRNRHAVHDPLYCFTGSGWQVAVDRLVDVPGGRARHVSLYKPSRPGRPTNTARTGQQPDRAEVVFWFSDGSRRHASITRYWWQATLRRLTGGWSGPEPLLVLVQNYDQRPVDWTPVLRGDGPLFEL